MFEARMAQASLLRKVLDAVRDLVSDANLECAEDGIALKALDTSHVAVVLVFLERSGFETYTFDGPLKLGLNLTSLSKILKCGNGDDALVLRTIDSEPDLLHVVFDGGSRERDARFDVKLMDLDSDDLEVPATEYAASVKLPSGEFTRICKDLSTIGEDVMITVENETGGPACSFKTSGDIGAADLTCRPSTEGMFVTEVECTDRFTGFFTLKYLSAFAKATPLAPYVKLHMLKGTPMLVEFTLVGIGYIRYYVGAKVDEDE
jgi:proliferating cell nuclear antigen